MITRLLFFVFVFIVYSASYAQVTFFGEPIPVDSLNSANGQNYLTLSPHQFRLAFTEEYTGSVSLDDFHVEEHQLNEEEWKVDVLLDKLNDDVLITPIGYDERGGLYFSEVTKEYGLIHKGTVHYLTRSGKSVPVDIPYLKNQSPLQSGCLSKDGQYMILSLEGHFTYGVEDLYVAKRNDDGSWESVTNLGSELNSKYQEVTPFLAADNRTLFFASNRVGGKGSFDIYYSIRQDDSWRSWSEPVSVAKINTHASETSFSFVGTDPWAYFVRAQNSDAYGEVMQVRIEQEIVEDTSFAETFVGLESIAHFKVVDIETHERIPSTMIVLDDSTVVEKQSGIFRLDTLKGKTVEFKSQGYLSMMLKVTKNVRLGENVVALERLRVGKTIKLEHVLFERATSNILDGSQEDLDLLVEMMQENPKMKILLKGHTDNQGNSDSNKRLSQERVDVVKEYLKFKGISKYRIDGVGYGGEQPIASNDSEETRRLNRRVEFEIMKD